MSGADRHRSDALTEVLDPANLISEMKRRRVFRALVGYDIAAFAVLQIHPPREPGRHRRTGGTADGSARGRAADRGAVEARLRLASLLANIWVFLGEIARLRLICYAEAQQGNFELVAAPIGRASAMTKYHPSDDGKIIDGKVVVFLKSPWSASSAPAGDGAASANDDSAPEPDESGASADPPGTPGGIPDAPFAIETELTAAGGTPLAAETVRIVDPDTDQQVGMPGVTDEKGVFRARVPEEKEYHLFAVHDGAEKEVDAWSGAEHAAPSHSPAPDGHPLLVVVVVDAKGLPVAGETVHVKGETGKEKWDLETDGRGRLEMEVEAGLFTLEARGKKFVAHSVFNGDLHDETAPYKFVLA